MSDSPIRRALSVALAEHDPTPDAELLRRFVEEQDASAFELLVRRHAELVWTVCQVAFPRDRHTAEDIFQAAFLALARKAGTIRDRSAAGWLFRVARNAALRARSGLADQAASPLPESLPAPGESAETEAERKEIGPIVTEEVDRLAAKFRDPVVLCFFEGHTHAEAAERLGWSIGTVASRLARAKDQLRARLTRRGVVLPAAGVAGVFAPSPLSAAPDPLVRSAVATALGPVAQVPPGILSLTQGVLSAMRLTKLQPFAIVAIIALGFTAALVAAPWTANEQPPPSSGKSAAPVTGPGKAAKGPEAADQKSLQGAWKVTKLVRDGTEIPAKERERMRWEFVQDKLLITADGPHGRKVESVTVTLAPGQSPKAIDLTQWASSSNTFTTTLGGVSSSSEWTTSLSIGTIRGIYELTGGTLKVCIFQAEVGGEARPTAFESGKAVDLVTLERVTVADELKLLAGEWKVAAVSAPGPGMLSGEVKTMRWAVNGAELVVTAQKDRREKYTIKLTPGATRSTIDLTLTDGVPPGEKGSVIRGIYAFRGNHLTLCLADPRAGAKQDTRPTEFRAGDGNSLITLERVPTAAEALKALQGSWQLVRSVSKGKEMDAERVAKTSIVVRDEQFDILDDGGAPLQMRMKLSPGPTPSELDLIGVQPEDLKRVTLMSIYEIKGDTLTMCLRDFRSAKEGRPKEFKSDDTCFLWVLKRVPTK